ncbi:hypothetical protein [Nocardia brasiliensis]|uniref:hypothetical protein n=1 Tax=Nocardia brasiliensis TaxID=37326 RepID=UPI00030363BA|nr:hypothetical protein [Nocardia brasiliensis]SUB09352.1 Uncharacterised protein [Nocardia brasiliensis]
MRLGVGLLAVSVLAAGCEANFGAGEWSDWTVTVNYTAVESYHDGPREPVRGCADADCTDPDAEIGLLPSDFIAAVREEGTGRITSGAHAGTYLNWSYDTGFWLDSAPRDAAGEILRPFHSAAADGLDPGTRLRLTDCGIIDPEAADACTRFQSAEWFVGDEFIPGFGGPHHLDLYVGEETAPDFTDTPDFVLFAGATVEPVV